MINQQFFISVIIPVYNGERFLAEAIKSIMKQNYQPLEIIVIDDGSTDKTVNVASRFKDITKYIYQENSGVSRARNTGIKMAKGDLITFLDADDLFPSNSLEKYVDFMKKNIDVDIVQGYTQDQWLYKIEDDRLLFESKRKPHISFNVGSAIWKKSVFEKIGLFNESMSYGEDVDLWVKVNENSMKKVIIERITLFYRRYKSYINYETARKNMSLMKVMKQYLDRSRHKL
ncbi:glycosyltransferase family A protein [Geminocystis sp. GBBB08]|uniref:glycosyltransferase family 2 protein n=1 Tax=Geminocystis sp. GBBB08 TaxID=2604140 RepID=UPI0027E23607|nr:glycosyltransferase family A protein [Geminocystis sp. GBBB08]MBL1211076.1 glycosyltransferase family 2 protein [Geminocystis sp. GBBB08]